MLWVQPRPWLSDRIAWVIFAAGVAAMFGVLYVSLAFGGYGDTIADLRDRRTCEHSFSSELPHRRSPVH